MIKKQEANISALKGTESRVIKKNIKFGIQIPQVIETLRLNKNIGNHMWRDGLVKDINAVMIEFKIIDEGENPPPTYQEI